MGKNMSEQEFENLRLKKTIRLAQNQIESAKLDNEDNRTEIMSLKQELRENATHSVSNLWSSQGFEALVELSQLADPITRKVEDYETVARRIAILELLVQSPYFARIDFRFEGEQDTERIYIGRASLTEQDTCEMYVYDWRSPIASAFYRFTLGSVYYDAPAGRIEGEVSLKRQYEIKRGMLEYFFDADVQIVDEFLRKMLSQNTSSKMKTIVETIQKEQDTVIRDMDNELMMVQGVAGSGKTSIALHRAAYLMYQGLSERLSASNIMIISPNSLFEQYISNVLPELGEDNVVTAVMEELYGKILKNKNIQTRNRYLEILITSRRYRNVMKKSMEFKTSGEFMKILDRFIKDIPHRWMKFEDVYYSGKCVISGDKLKSMFLSGRESTPLGQRLMLLEEQVLEQVRALHKTYANRDELQRVKNELQDFIRLNAEQLYAELISNKEYFYTLAEGIILPDNIEDILSYTCENLRSKSIRYDDGAVLMYLKLKIDGTNEYKAIKQVVIDEAQDYYPLHYEIFKMLFKNAKYTILGDINQTLEKQESMSLYDEISRILDKRTSVLVTMDKSFRCTNEILNFSAKFIPHEMNIKSFNRKGKEPEIHVAADNNALLDMLADHAKKRIEEGYGSVGLICKTEKGALALHKALRGKLEAEIIRHESRADLQGVFIIPVYMSKGLEFDAVLICDADKEHYSTEDDKKLMYIACTRALHQLDLFCVGDSIAPTTKY